jgi:four helix bundle protein
MNLTGSAQVRKSASAQGGECASRTDRAETGYRKLIVWRRADELAFRAYSVTRGFPKEELYGMTSQLRRAVLSVPTNIAEGYGRRSNAELRQFLNIALGSLAEVEYLLDFSHRLGYLPVDDYRKLQDLRAEVGRLLWGFYKSL